ncbi:MAG: hypothetical protein OXG15_14535 [Gammaproteobacteria bacterium]|nr:hypothetical protein [Gammaproteobacteria bacterium]
MSHPVLQKFLQVALGVFSAYVCLNLYAVPVGPKLPAEESKSSSTVIGPSYERLDIPSLDFAVVVFDPQLDANDDRMREKGVWPEVRKTESIRSAYRVKEAITRLNQFDQVTVAPSASVSADLYLRGKILESTSEIMKIRWNLIDARGFEWIDWKTSDHRVALGWHQRFYEPGKDAFQPLWNEIARDVYDRLKDFAKNHADIAKQNESRSDRGRSPRLSRLDEITHTRDLVLARFFAPDLYGDTIEVNDRDQWEIKYLPDPTTEEWLRIQAFSRKDQEVASLYDKHYAGFFEQVNPNYEKWLNEVFPYAREMRLEERRYKVERAVGGIVLAASAVAAAEADSEQARENALALGSAIGGGLIFKSLIDRADFKENLGLFDEMSQSYHDTFAPVNLQIEGETVTLQGQAATQFERWRQVVHDIYSHEQTDAYTIHIVDE